MALKCTLLNDFLLRLTLKTGPTVSGRPEHLHEHHHVMESLQSTWDSATVLPTTTTPDTTQHQSFTITTSLVDQQIPITQEQMMIEFPTVFDGNIKIMEGEQSHIHLTDNAKPFRVSTPRTIPFAYHEKLKTELELLQKQNIIAPITEATESFAPIVVTPKKNSDSIHMCVDLSHLNRYVKHELYQSATPAEAVADISTTKAKFFTILDAMKGYHQCPLDPESQLLTTFNTLHGRFKYLRAPY